MTNNNLHKTTSKDCAAQIPPKPDVNSGDPEG